MKHIYALLYLVGQVLALSGQCPETLVIQLDSTAIRTLNSNPVTIVPAPVSGSYIQVDKIEITYQAGTVKYLGDPILTFYYNGQAEGSLFSQQLYGIYPMASATPMLNEQVIAPNAALLVTIDSNRTKGNDGLTIYVTYRVVSLTNPTECMPDTITLPSTTGSICTEIIHVTSAQILNLNAVPATLISAPPTGKYINVLSCQVKVYGATAYAGNFIATIFEGDTNQFIASNATALVVANDTIIETFGLIRSQGRLTTAAPLQATVLSGNPSTGTGSLDFIVTYQILDESQGYCSGVPRIPYSIDSLTDLAMDTVELQLNKTNIVVAQGAATNIVFVFPQGSDGDVIEIINTQQLTNAIPEGSGISTITVWRLLQMAKDPEMTLRCVGTNWY